MSDVCCLLWFAVGVAWLLAVVVDCCWLLFAVVCCWLLSCLLLLVGATVRCWLLFVVSSACGCSLFLFGVGCCLLGATCCVNVRCLL